MDSLCTVEEIRNKISLILGVCAHKEKQKLLNQYLYLQYYFGLNSA